MHEPRVPIKVDEAKKLAKGYVEDLGHSVSEKLIKSMSQESLEGEIREGRSNYV
jgi:hypothetical protein